MLLAVVAVILLIPVAGLATLSLLSRRPENLGVADGRLGDCPASPNCISSRAPDLEHAIAPIKYEGLPQAALMRLQEAIKKIPRARIVRQDGSYLHVEARSRIFRFVDDLEFLMDPGLGIIHLRSAARAGYSDFGVNRKRMEAIRREF